LLPKGLKKEIQIVATALSVDQENPPEVLAIIGGSTVLALSGIPFDGPVGATRVSYVNGQYILNPTYAQINDSTLSVVVAGTRDGVMMVEAGADEATEEVVLEAMRRAQEANAVVVDMIEELVAVVGTPKEEYHAPHSHNGLEGEVQRVLNGRLAQMLDSSADKTEREESLAALEGEVVAALAQDDNKAEVSATFQSILKEAVRSQILNQGKRPDGRGLNDIRPISSEVGILERTHGTGLFTRGLTQVLTVATLGSPAMEQTLDTLSPEATRRFMHHYNFPGYSTGEVRRIGSPGRREIGHGALAERAIEPIIPSLDDFPYAIRLVSEVLSSNGSTSMASVCGSTLALMDAGVPIKAPVAGVAMGLISGDNGQYAVLTDIEGFEDALGDMDFKVAGTSEGINALQMDIKIKGITHEVLTQALEQAREARLFILGKIAEAITEPRPQVSAYAPKMVRTSIPVDKIGALIGPGGRNIRGIQEETGASIDVDDKGSVTIGSNDQSKIDAARARIDGLTRELAVGDIFTGKVTRVTSLGAFVELLPGKDGLLRSSEAGTDLEEEMKVGQELTVMVLEIDAMGRVNLSRRALFEGAEGPDGRPPRPAGQRPPFPRSSPGGPRTDGGNRPPRPGSRPSGPYRPSR
jgi:polyribonucleotide nucleotidyltransferase